MIARHVEAPLWQSFVDLYCHFPPKTTQETHRGLSHIKRLFDAQRERPQGCFKSLVLNEVCFPLAISNHWAAAVQFFQGAEKLASSVPQLRWSETLRMVQNFPCEGVFRFLRHASQSSTEMCQVVEALLRKAYYRELDIDADAVSILIENLSALPLKRVSASFGEVLYAHAVRLGMPSEVKWLFCQQRAPASGLQHLQEPTQALEILNLSLRHNMHLRRTDVSQTIQQLIRKMPRQTESLITIAQKYDAMNDASSCSVYHEACLNHYVKRNQWQLACGMFQSSVRHGVQLSPQALCDFAVAMLLEGRWQVAARSLNAYLDIVPNIPLDTFGRLIKLFIRLGKLSIAHAFMRHHSPLIVTDYALSNLLHFLAQDGEWAMLLSIYEKLQPRPSEASTRCIIASPEISWAQRSCLASTAIGYENFLSQFTARQWKAAIATYQLMLDRSVLINYKILTKVLMLCSKANRWEPALSIYTRIREVHASHRGIDLYAGYMANLHHCLHLNGKWELNAALYSASVVSPTEMSANFCVASAVSVGKWPLALQIINRMVLSGQKLSCISANAIQKAQRSSSHDKVCWNMYAKALALLDGESKSGHRL